MTVPAVPAELLACQPGDICVVRTGGFFAKMIRFGAALRGWPNLDNHVVGIHHVDDAGTVWGIEGRPGGVGWVDVARYFSGPYGKYAITNRKQPKTDKQRSELTTIMVQLLKTGYDWDAIAEDAIQDLDLPTWWHQHWGVNGVPAHVVCSSLYAWGYMKLGLAAPRQVSARNVEPANWETFIIEERWKNAA